MRTTRLIAVLVGLGAIAIFAADASAYYHPAMGCFMSRDPGPGGANRVGAGGPAVGGGFMPRDPTGSNQYADGMDLYQYVGSNPIARRDPMGLKWTVQRYSSMPKAWARADCDPLDDLAKEIGLDIKEWQQWLLPWGPGSPWRAPQGNDQLDYQLIERNGKIIAKGQFSIPNTVLAYWAGEVGGCGKWWVRWDSDVNTLKERGFHVVEKEDWMASQLESYIQSSTKDPDLHGIFFWGHGYIGGVLTDSDHKQDWRYYSDYKDWKPAYKLGLGVLFACHTQSGRGQFAPGAIFWGKTGVLVPHGFHLFGPRISSLVPPGAGGTRK